MRIAAKELVAAGKISFSTASFPLHTYVSKSCQGESFYNSILTSFPAAFEPIPTINLCVRARIAMFNFTFANLQMAAAVSIKKFIGP